MIRSMLLGAIAMACFTISLIFVRFWTRTHDRFFLFFAAAFAVAGVGRLIFGMVAHASDHTPMIYALQLLAFLIIICAIIDKNRAMRRYK